MAVAVTNAPELSEQRRELSGRTLLVNTELGDFCPLTKSCSTGCYLHWSHAKASPQLPTEKLLQAGLETFGKPIAGSIRHWALAGKEALMHPDAVMRIARAWHEAEPNLRPGTLGILTAAAGPLVRQAKTWQSCPIPWVLVSADPSSTLLHKSYPRLILEAASEAKGVGGVKIIGVNTTVALNNWEEICHIGKRAESLGFDQWSLGGLYVPKGNYLEDAWAIEEVSTMIELVCREFADSPLDITFNVSPERYRAFVGKKFPISFETWRLEKEITTNVKLIAPNPRPGFFLRVRWDGQMLDNQDLLSVGLVRGTFGKFSPGSMETTLADLVALRGKEWNSALLAA